MGDYAKDKRKLCGVCQEEKELVGTISGDPLGRFTASKKVCLNCVIAAIETGDYEVGLTRKVGADDAAEGGAPTDQCATCTTPESERYLCFVPGMKVADNKTCEIPLSSDHFIYDALSGIHEEG